MNRTKIFNHAAVISILVIMLSYVIFPVDASAQSTCLVEVAKLEVGTSGTEFEFNITNIGGGDVTFTLLGNEDTRTFGIAPRLDSELTELVPPDWQLFAVDCEGDPGIDFTQIDNGVIFECTSPGAFGVCVFSNRRVPNNIPTISEWGMIAVAAGFGLIGLYYVIRRKRVAA